MTSAKRKTGARAASAKYKGPALRLIDVAERLFAMHGIDGVSLLEIGRAAGQANKFAVQYHFGTRENLVSAIFETRLARIADRRRIIMDRLKETNSIAVDTLIMALIEPVRVEVGDDGLHHFARFSSRAFDSPLAMHTWLNLREAATGVEVTNLLRESVSFLTAEQFEIRLLLLIELLVGALSVIDRLKLAQPQGENAAPKTISEREVLDQAIAAGCKLFE